MRPRDVWLIFLMKFTYGTEWEEEEEEEEEEVVAVVLVVPLRPRIV